MTRSALSARALSTARNAFRAVFTLPPFLVGHALRSRHVERSQQRVDSLSEQPPPNRPHPRLQRRSDGVGPVVMRTYEVRIAEPRLSAVELMAEFRTNPNYFNSDLVARFVQGGRPARNLQPDDELVVEIPGPWNGPCTVEVADDSTVLLATLEGHMEAGHIRFRTVAADETPTIGYTFQIRSWATAGDAVFAALHLGIEVGKELQTAMWCAMCDRAVAISGGRRVGAITVATEELHASGDDDDEDSDA